ncbi:TetR/AcrR family transcriptional regulator [Anaerocolumna sp. AGMB13020]|uniref:TetR/AcrR family transcriptional regulator n=1 Tax=Anaerocolumna sp. AGMB13020 TaxID=3081750 RepID=UPI0029535BCF|nr:TetR/AcrR family transcriptional regulator [Anaerocolumna sp. AGMB13020]WOO36638.1 TetR/AcrR family transcriptional regulator [Anaerocolumna sp. AGMB13020]
MAETKIDPRIIRTRKLIMDAFIHVLKKKEFKDITINDITAEATVNRATFYYHFIDKYDLLDKVMKEEFMTNVFSEIAEYKELNPTSIINIFLSITNFQSTLSKQCRSGFETFKTTIEEFIQKELENIFYQMLLKQNSTVSDESIRIAAVMLSWGIFGASVDWQHNNSVPPEEYIKLAIPYVMYGVGH